jgi:RHS repeat-associated protein
LTDSTGAIQTQYSYEPFGATTETGATSSNWYQFTGRANDGTGLYYYRARYYSPRFQRFISEDPIGFNGGINEYAYALDSPTNYTDPGGQQWQEIPLAIGCSADPLACAAAFAIATEPIWGPAVANWARHAASSADDADAPPDAQSQSVPDNPSKTTKKKCPPVPVPRCPECGWKWNEDSQNPRGGTWGPKGWKGPNPPSASWDPARHWDVDDGFSNRSRYDPNGNPITPEQAHP